LLQRARIFICFITESDGLDAGEKVDSIRVEKPLIIILLTKFITRLWNSLYANVNRKSGGDGAIKEIAEKVFSFGIDELYSNPIQFYFQKILRIREVEEVENIALNTLGTIIHETLKRFTNLS
jgi:hypothetical protein